MEESPVVRGKLAKHYAENYYTIENDILPIFEKLDTPLLDKKLESGMKVLDAMMGRGRHTIRYARRGCSVHGNDLNPYMVAVVRKAAKLAGVQLTLTATDVCTLKGIASNTFDATIAMFSALGTISQAKNRQQAMHAMARVTRPGGRVIIHAHNRLDMFLEPTLFWAAVQITLLPKNGLQQGDVLMDYNGLRKMFNHYYTPREFRTAFKKVGLTVVEEHYMDYEKKKFITGRLRKLHANGFIFVGVKQTF
jgi:ubiquinone/menaquinone biosynthesis C-methylase UbiE